MNFPTTKMVTKLWQRTSSKTNFTVLIASKSPAISAELEKQLSSSKLVRVVGKAEENEDAGLLTSEFRPDVLIIHAPTFGEPSVDLLSRLVHIHPELKTLALECSPDHVRTCFIQLTAWGLRGCICHWKGANELIRAIRTIGNGDVYLCPVASHALVDAYRDMIHQLLGEEA